MKWKNVDIGPGYYFVTGTVTEWQPLLTRERICSALVFDIKLALRRVGGSVAAYVIMPDHIHLLVSLTRPDTLHEFCKVWRGRSARHILDLLKRRRPKKLVDFRFARQRRLALCLLEGTDS